MRKARQLLLTLLIIGMVGLASFATFSAFSSTTQNSGNSFAAGTVYIADNDAGSAMYSLTNQKPGVTTSRCIKVTYSGSLDADVKLYSTSSIGSVGQYVNLTITPGTQVTSVFPDCTGFVADATGALYSGTLANFVSTHGSYANGLADFPGTLATKWATNDSVVYRFDVSVQDDNNANGGASGALSTGSHTFIWEARNQ
jgi:hypothetical protein